MSAQLLEKLARPELLAMQGYSSARMEAGPAPIVLNANENPWPPACDCDPDWRINRYPPPQPVTVVQRLAQIYAIPEQRLLITRGSDEGIDLLVRAFCRAGVDSISYCPPTFGMYAVSAAIQDARLVAIPLLQDNQWALDLEALVRTRAKLVFLCRPNNPTGHMLSIDTLQQLCKRLTDQALVIVDEAYIEFADQPDALTELARFPNLVVLRTLSKAWGMAGLRCGAVIAAPEIIRLLRKIMAPYPLSIATQELVGQALSEANVAQMRQRVRLLRQERERINHRLSGMACIHTCWPSQANFLLLKVADAGHLCSAAAHAGILIRNQSSQPGLADCVRISIGTPAENNSLLAFLATYQEPA